MGHTKQGQRGVAGRAPREDPGNDGGECSRRGTRHTRAQGHEGTWQVEGMDKGLVWWEHGFRERGVVGDKIGEVSRASTWGTF